MVTAIAVLVVLALLGSFIVNVTGVQQRTIALDLLGARAYQAAKAGTEWIGYQIYNPENTNPAGGPYTTPYSCAGPTNISGLDADLVEFTITVTCSASTYTEYGNSVRIYEVAATACNIPAAGACPNNAPNSPSYAERQLTGVIATCRLPGGASC